MTEPQALRIICEAALLDDTEAADLLRKHYTALPYNHECKGPFLLALAWLHPEEARDRMADMGFWAHTVQTRIEHLCEALALNQGEAEGLLAYRTMTSLLPQKPLRQDPRLQVQRYALALYSPEKYIPHADLIKEKRDPFLIARLWHRHTGAFWEKAADSSALIQAIGRFVLAQRAGAEDLPALLTLFYKPRKEYLEGMDEGQEFENLLRTMSAFEASLPMQKKALASQALAALAAHDRKVTAVLAARVIGAAARAGLDTTGVIGPVAERPLSHRWLAQVRKTISTTAPVPPVALEQIRILRGFALIQLLETYLYEAPEQHKVNLAWRWLLRSERLISSLADPFWRQRLHQKREELVDKIRKSRRRRHTVARRAT